MPLRESRTILKATVAVLFGLGAPLLLAAPRLSDWSPPVNLGAPINSAFNETGPALSKDGLALYFTSDRPGSLGGNDMWVSQRASLEDPWGEPVNLGPTVNTAFNEGVPSFSRDDHFMYFNSVRPGGFGSNDIWIAWREHTHDDFGWGTPINAGSGINGPSNDAGAAYVENEEEGTPLLYFGSTRPGGPGSFDIYVSAQAADGTWAPAVLVPELSGPFSDQRPSVRFDGLELFFFSNRPGSLGPSDVWSSTRETTGDVWSAPVNVGPTVNGPFTDSTEFISSDRESLIFASDRSGGHGNSDLYMTTREKDRQD